LLKPTKAEKRPMKDEEAESFNQNRPASVDKDLFNTGVKLSDVGEASSKSFV